MTKTNTYSIFSRDLSNNPDDSFFIETGSAQIFKHLLMTGGDVFLSKKLKEDNRIISVLSDGLGSGVKANVLATLTSAMALNFISNSKDIKSTAEIIMRTLPVCKKRKISYSTFTIVDITYNGKTRITEYDNPPFILIRDNKIVEVEHDYIKLEYNKNKENTVVYSEFPAAFGDRIVFFTDGVTQAGIGTPRYPKGWGAKNTDSFLLDLIHERPGISARELADTIVNKAVSIDSFKAQDDITCGVVYFRKPRKLMIISGPSVYKERDSEIAGAFRNFDGKKIVCGGSTAGIIARELGTTVYPDSKDRDPEIPPCSFMEGADLVTEGTFTLGKILDALEEGTHTSQMRYNAVKRVLDILFDSDIIYFLTGTKINEIHQDPGIPVELDLRRNLIKNIARLLEDKYMKKTHIRFI